MWLEQCTQDFSKDKRPSLLWYCRVIHRCDSYGALLLFRTIQLIEQGRDTFMRQIVHFLLLKRYNKVCSIVNLTLSPKTKIGKGLVFPHGFPLVINSDAIIGENCIIHPCVLIGRNRMKAGAPIIGDNVFIGHGSKIIGNPKIGDWCFIAPSAIITKDIASGSVVGSGLNNILSNDGEKYVMLYHQ